MKKIVYVIPGHDEFYDKQKGYKVIGKLFEEQDFQVYPIKINWKVKDNNFDNYIQQFNKQANRHSKKDQVVILGYSFGAMIALKASASIKPNLLILCSLSPYYVENYSSMRPSWLSWWKKHFSNEYSFHAQIKPIKFPVYFVFGALEDISIKKLARLGRSSLEKSRLFIASEAKHNLHSKFYLSKLGKIINKLPFDLSPK